MRVLVLYCHPVEESFGASLHKEVVSSLTEAGHEVDDCDLYAEGFNPIMSREDRLNYHTVPENLDLMGIREHVERLRAADGIVIVSPIWNFGWPAMLKGYFDKVWVPGVTFDLVDGKLQSKLFNIQKLISINTYGADPFRAFLAGNPPGKIIHRVFRATIKPGATIKQLKHWSMDRSTDASRKKFLARVRREMERF